MKNKFLGKLILSGAALAACATTLVTSTYAWYTSNTEVSATGVQGTSSANGSSLLLISKARTDGTFSNSVNLDVNTTTMQPVQYTDNEGIIEINGWSGNAVSTSEAGAASYASFDLYFKGVDGENGVNVNLNKFILKNTTTALPAKDVLSTVGLPTDWNVSTNATYKVDILRAIKVGYVTYMDETSVLSTEVVSHGVLDTEALALAATGKTAFEDSLASDTTFNAIEYLNAVTGNDLEAPETSPLGTVTTPTKASNDVTFGVTPNSTATNYDLHVKFYVFIDGWDLACFDAIQGQSISLQLGFTSAEVNTGIAVE